MIHKRFAIVAIGLALTLGAVSAGEDPKRARNIQLVLFGGPPPGDLEITINDELVGKVEGAPPDSLEIAGMLEPGANTLEVRMTPSAGPRADVKQLIVQVSPVTDLGAQERRAERPLAQIEIPAELEGGGLECTQATRFWAGPAPGPQALNKRYYLGFDGAPVRHWVTVSLNGTPLYGANNGGMLFEITDFVARGRNEVIFDLEPSCMVRPSGPADPFRVFIATGELEGDVATLDQPVVIMEYERSLDKNERSQRRNTFRGR